MSALIIDIILWGSVAALAMIALRRGRPVLMMSLREGSLDFINIVPRIALGVIGSGYIAAVIPPRLLRLSNEASPALFIATTSWEGVAPGTSTSNGPELQHPG